MRRHPPLIALIRSYITSAGGVKKQLLDDILAYSDAERRIYDKIFSDNQRACLRVLADSCRKKKSREALKPLVIRDAAKLMAVSDAKARKTAANLIGTCAPNECAPTLIRALHQEETRFVRPSIILALGNTAHPERYLSDYTVQPGEEKHVREETAALKKALGKAQKNQAAANVRLPDMSSVTYVNRKAIIAELEAHDLPVHKSSILPGAFEVPTHMLKGLRCFFEAHYSIGRLGAFAQAAEKLDTFGLKGLSYRIETGHLPPDRRKPAIDTVSKGLSAHGYLDNPHAYVFEIRIIDNEMFVLFQNDRRFAYRKQSVPASIHPVTAASIMRLCRPYMKEDAAVLDPFCGSGTMLIERDKILKTGSLVGVDIAPPAIKAAVTNRSAARVRISFIKSDIRAFGESQFDEVYANMPFGIRVSDHASNEKLYAAFADKLNTLLRTGGTAFLYTQEKKLLKNVFENHDKFCIIQREKFISGGLSPTLYIIQRRPL